MSDTLIRVAVVGAGVFGRHHVRIWSAMPGARLVGVFDTDPETALRVSKEFGVPSLPDLEAVTAEAQAVSLAVPTIEHFRIGCLLLDAGLDVLVEKPIASSLEEADGLIAAAQRSHRILQVGHLERFNPAVIALAPIINRPLFFEVHRLGIFSPRSLDVDVVFDVMIHDLDILLSLVHSPVIDLHAVGIPILTDKVDIAQARIEFASGAVANLTASRVSTERIRKLRFFQEHEYVSVDYTRQDVLRVRVKPGTSDFDFEKLETHTEEPLLAELRGFLESVRSRRPPLVDGHAGRHALDLAGRVMQDILAHARRVQVNAPPPGATS
jgi:predicted dehydrogenase